MTKDEIRRWSCACCARSRRRSARADRSDGELARQLDLDSVDFMNFVVGLHAALGVDVPEAEYNKLASLDACVAYLAAQRGK